MKEDHSIILRSVFHLNHEKYLQSEHVERPMNVEHSKKLAQSCKTKDLIGRIICYREDLDVNSDGTK